jgi:hypothetical protein
MISSESESVSTVVVKVDSGLRSLNSDTTYVMAVSVLANNLPPITKLDEIEHFLLLLVYISRNDAMMAE